MTIKTLYPNVRPTLDLAFAATKALDPRITFTRASAGTYVGSDGTLRTAGVNEARFDHSPLTLESLGLLVEEARTNSIRNNTMVGAVAGTPGTLPTNWSLLGGTGLTTQVVGTGTENGITYLDFKFSGTTGNTFTGVQVDGGFSGLETASSYATSFYLKRTAGSLTNLSNAGIYLRYNLTPSGQTDISGTVSSLAGPGDALILSRYTAVGTTTGTLSGVGSVFILFSHSSGVAVDLTLRIGLPQTEKGAFATSPIPTSTAAATRSADLASITGNAFSSWYRQDEGSFFCSTFAPKGTVIYGTGDTFDNTQYVSAALSNNVSIRSGSVGSATLTAPVSTTTVTNIAHGYAANNFAAVSNGGTIATDISGPVPASQVRLKLGSSAWDEGGLNNLNGTIRRLTYWPWRLSNATLQALTS